MSEPPTWPDLLAAVPELRPREVELDLGCNIEGCECGCPPFLRFHGQPADDWREPVAADLCLAAAVRWLAERSGVEIYYTPARTGIHDIPGKWVVRQPDDEEPWYYGFAPTLDEAVRKACGAVRER